MVARQNADSAALEELRLTLSKTKETRLKVQEQLDEASLLRSQRKAVNQAEWQNAQVEQKALQQAVQLVQTIFSGQPLQAFLQRRRTLSSTITSAFKIQKSNLKKLGTMSLNQIQNSSVDQILGLVKELQAEVALKISKYAVEEKQQQQDFVLQANALTAELTRQDQLIANTEMAHIPQAEAKMEQNAKDVLTAQEAQKLASEEDGIVKETCAKSPSEKAQGDGQTTQQQIDQLKNALAMFEAGV